MRHAGGTTVHEVDRDMAAGRLRFVQTGDWHLGQAYRNVGPELAERLRGARLEAVGRGLGLAERLRAAFVVVVGDQFDGPRPDPDVVRGMLDRIAAHPTLPVHMIPGNHDPAEPGSAYALGAFVRGAPANLQFHRRAEPVPLPDLGATL